MGAYNKPVAADKRCHLDTAGKDTSEEGNKDEKLKFQGQYPSSLKLKHGEKYIQVKIKIALMWEQIRDKSTNEREVHKHTFLS